MFPFLLTTTFKTPNYFILYTRNTQVHFGVDACANSFKIEKQAFNEANFRLPDEDGYQPRNQPIVPSEEEDGTSACTIESCLHTKLGVEDVVEKLREEGFNVQVSHDAGRYVCNYTYFCSLNSLQEVGRSLYSVLVHVPSFHAIDPATQIRFVSALIDRLAHEARKIHAHAKG